MNAIAVPARGRKSVKKFGSEETQSGNYYRIDYDAYLDRYSANHPDWWNVHDYLGHPRLLDGGWYETIAAGLAAKLPMIELGRLANEWPAVSVACLRRDRKWLRADLSLGGSLAASTLLLCGVDKAAETLQLREFNTTAGKQPRGRVKDGWSRPYRVRERPLCASVWLIDKNDSTANNTVNSALQALASAFFRSKWVA